MFHPCALDLHSLESLHEKLLTTISVAPVVGALAHRGNRYLPANVWPRSC